jgi:serine/threonine protein kinase
MSHQVATRQYRAPELLFASRTYNEKVDIWSIAVVKIELILLRTLFPSHNDIDQMSKVFQVVGSPTPDRWPVNHSNSFSLLLISTF